MRVETQTELVIQLSFEYIGSLVVRPVIDYHLLLELVVKDKSTSLVKVITLGIVCKARVECYLLRVRRLSSLKVLFLKLI